MMSEDATSVKAKNTFSIKDPLGKTIEVPVSLADDIAYFKSDDMQGIRSYYEAEGYVVVRGLFDPEECDRAHEAFEKEIKPAKSFIYRQATANPERNVYTEHGFVLNSIQNVQSVDPTQFPQFRKLGSDIVTAPKVQAVLRGLFDEPGKLVQSMYFEGNQATWAHQDTYYLDSEKLGAMVAAWFAVEEIKPGAGRFFVYPKSHLSDMAKNGGDFDIAFNHGRYKELVKRIIEEQGFECRAPFLGKGDVLFWNGKTIHGSLETRQPEFSRRSFTGHYIPESHRLMQFQSVIKSMELKPLNGMNANHPKDLASIKNRAILAVETTFPKTFLIAKKLAIKAVTAK